MLPKTDSRYVIAGRVLSCAIGIRTSSLLTFSSWSLKCLGIKAVYIPTRRRSHFLDFIHSHFSKLMDFSGKKNFGLHRVSLFTAQKFYLVSHLRYYRAWSEGQSFWIHYKSTRDWPEHKPGTVLFFISFWKEWTGWGWKAVNQLNHFCIYTVSF